MCEVVEYFKLGVWSYLETSPDSSTNPQVLCKETFPAHPFEGREWVLRFLVQEQCTQVPERRQPKFLKQREVQKIRLQVILQQEFRSKIVAKLLVPRATSHRVALLILRCGPKPHTVEPPLVLDVERVVHAEDGVGKGVDKAEAEVVLQIYVAETSEER